MTVTAEILEANGYNEEQVNAALACFDTIFGENQGLDEAILGAMLNNPAFVAAMEACIIDKEGPFGETIQTCIADAIVNPDSPFTKEWLGTITQGLDPTEELVADEDQEGGFTTSTGIKLLSVTASKARVAKAKAGQGEG